ncbi:unnamed protein product, partial [Ceratitis capitata]
LNIYTLGALTDAILSQQRYSSQYIRSKVCFATLILNDFTYQKEDVDLEINPLK